MYNRIFFAVVATYWLIGLIRTSLSWRGHRSEIVRNIAGNRYLKDLYFPPWLEWIASIPTWPFWWTKYKLWRTTTKLMKANE